MISRKEFDKIFKKEGITSKEWLDYLWEHKPAKFNDPDRLRDVAKRVMIKHPGAGTGEITPDDAHPWEKEITTEVSKS